jgi:thioredoxin 1
MGLGEMLQRQSGRRRENGLLRPVATFLAISILALLLGEAVEEHLLPPCLPPPKAAAADSLRLKGIDNPKKLPLLLDFGMGVCIPCRMMKPVLEEVAREYDGRLMVKILELDQHRELARQFRIRLIPTQIFINSKGEVVHRHEGFMDKASIVAVLDRMGVKRR